MASKAYQRDREAARKAVYESHVEGPCPFDAETEPRKCRLWEKIRRHYWNMEALM